MKKITIQSMKKGIFIFYAFVLTLSNAFAVDNYISKRFNTITSHSDVYPYVLNNTKTTDTAAKDTSVTSARRAVVPRSTAARVQTKTTTSATPQNRRVIQRNNSVARAGTNMQMTTRTNRNVNYNNSSLRARAANVRTATNNTTYSSGTATGSVSSQRCFADYKECMEGYCQREGTAYNRCYCSAKLAQIDAKYQNKIDELTQKIVRLQYNTDAATSMEIREYWDQTVGTYTGDNPWVNIDNALNIEWADSQSRIRGQNAFNTGHEYCVQHLRACSYMGTNMRDAYKSEIARDCETYEKSLQKIKEAAESVIESYND